MVNHATKNETMEITVAPYLAGTVNHARWMKRSRLLTTLNLYEDWHGLLTQQW